MKQIKNKSLRERVLDSLRDAILSGELKPGQPLIETDLATQLGVSRAPLREAIHILNSEGLLETVPYHGTTVKQLTRTDIEELYSLRIVLETFAIQRILEREDLAGIDRLRHIYEDMRQAAEENDWQQVNEIDRHFHDQLIEMSDHGLLKTLWNTVAMRVQQIVSLRNRRTANMVEVANNHIPIIEALEARDLDKALDNIETHIASTGDLIIEGWEEAYELDGEAE